MPSLISKLTRAFIGCPAKANATTLNFTQIEGNSPLLNRLALVLLRPDMDKSSEVWSLLKIVGGGSPKNRSLRSLWSLQPENRSLWSLQAKKHYF